MANKATLTLIGDKELLAAFGALKDTVASRTMSDGLKRAAVPILDSAGAILRSQLSGNTERSYGKEPGNLLKSLGVRTRRYKNTNTQIAVIGPRWPEGAHGHLVEFGTAPRWAQNKGFFKQLLHGLKGGYRGIMPARPFLRPAFDGRVQEALALLTSFVRNKLLRVRLQQASKK